MYKWIKFERRILLHVLRRSSVAKVKLLTKDEVTTMQEVVVEKYPPYGDVWGAGNLLLIASQVSYRKKLNFITGGKALTT